MKYLINKIKSETFNLLEQSKLFLNRFRKTNKIDKCFIGISSGADSTLSAYLCKQTGFEVVGLILPGKANESVQIIEAQHVCKKLDIPYEIIRISEIEQKYKELLGIGDDQRIVAGNLSARIRMTILYAKANENNGIVIGTGDKSEYLLGYFTKYGDAGADIFPILNLYKTQVRYALEKLGFPEIAVKEPSPALWKGQRAEDELGISYEKADQILYALTNDLKQLKDFDDQEIALVIDKYRNSYHKRNLLSTLDMNEITRIEESVRKITRE
ncbi:MAG: NAD(+) synthase [Candidatus Micrarchaeota archaeon]|nr:NAD(+) synthase [Candidatus Micrarchaeota archaeon]